MYFPVRDPLDDATLFGPPTRLAYPLVLHALELQRKLQTSIQPSASPPPHPTQHRSIRSLAQLNPDDVSRFTAQDHPIPPAWEEGRSSRYI